MSFGRRKVTSLEGLLEHCLKLEFNDSAFLIFNRLYGTILDSTLIPQRFEDLKYSISNQIGDRMNYWNMSRDVSESQVDSWLQDLSSLIDYQNHLNLLEWRVAFSDRLSKYFEALLNWYLETENLAEVYNLISNLLCKELKREIADPLYRKAVFSLDWQQIIEKKKQEISRSEEELIYSLRRHMQVRISDVILSSKDIDHFIPKIPELYVMEWAERNNWRIEKHKQTVYESNAAEQELLFNSNASLPTLKPFAHNSLENPVLCLQLAYIEPTGRLVSIVTLNDNCIFRNYLETQSSR